MDPRYLSNDELEYELHLRRISVSDNRRVERLCQCLEAEDNGEVELPEDTVRLTRYTVTREVKDCHSKLMDVEKAWNDAIQNADDELTNQAQSRLEHLYGRVRRLQQFAPSHEAVNRLVLRILDLRGHANVARESLGAGEEGATAQPIEFGDVDTVVPTSNNVGGARPKTLLPIARPDKVAEKSVLSGRSSVERHMLLNPGAQEFSRRPKSIVNSQDIWRPSPIVRDDRSTEDNIPQDFPVNPFDRIAPNVREIFDDPAIMELGTGSSSNVRHHRPLQYASRATLSTIPNARQSQQRQVDNRPSFSQQASLGLAGGHRIHQWTLRFDGTSSNLDAEDFVFRVERQADLYGVTARALVIGIGDLLTGRASQWFWTHQRQNPDASWSQWKSDFFSRFTPHRESDFEIRARIEKKQQANNEKFADFCQDVEEMAIRLRRQMPEDELVEVLRRNMAMYLRKALWRDHFETVGELLRSCNKYERLCAEEQQQTVARRSMRVNEIAYDDLHQQSEYLPVRPEMPQQFVEAVNTELSLCWNCRDIGHLFMQCNKPQRGVFCFSCGMSGVMKVNCSKCSGNARKDSVQVGSTRPHAIPQPQFMHRPPAIPQNQRMQNLYNYPPPV